MTVTRKIRAALVTAAVIALGLGAPAAASASDTVEYKGLFIEMAGASSPGTSAGSANLFRLADATGSSVIFDGCGTYCHVRTVYFADGSTLVIEETPLGPWTSPGESGAHGADPWNLGGNPKNLEIAQTIVGGTGTFADASGGGTGTVRAHGRSAVIEVTGSITY